MRVLDWKNRFESELGRPGRPVQVKGFVRMMAGDSAKAVFFLFYFKTNPAKDTHQLKLCEHMRSV